MFLNGTSGTARAQSPVVMPVEIPAPISHVFVPVGFDDNDTVEVVIHGHFVNTCFKTGPAFGIVDDETKTVRISAKALSYPAAECLQMRIPFVQVVKLGRLPAGAYTVQVQGSSLPEAALDVAESTSANADDYLYAPVEDVLFEPASDDASSNRYQVTLNGVFPASEKGCMVLKEVTLLPFDGVLIVLPKAEFITEGPACVPGASALQRRFNWTGPVELNLTDDLLIHVRVLNGQSLNKVVEIQG